MDIIDELIAGEASKIGSKAIRTTDAFMELVQNIAKAKQHEYSTEKCKQCPDLAACTDHTIDVIEAATNVRAAIDGFKKSMKGGI